MSAALVWVGAAVLWAQAGTALLASAIRDRAARVIPGSCAAAVHPSSHADRSLPHLPRRQRGA